MSMSSAHEPQQILGRLRAALPDNGLLAQGDWLMSPRPFPVTAAEVADLEHLGHHFALFYRACDLLYRQSVNGKRPPWIATILDAGKPPGLIALARSKGLRQQLPRVIRPDLLLTPDGWAASELDNLPGGIGMTAWLNETYADFGFPVVGGRRGMVEGFASVAGGSDIVVSEEAGGYRSEMEWIAARIAASGADAARVVSDSEWAPSGRRIYRFFELFDLAQVRCGEAALEELGAGRLEMTPPPKPWLEEKLLFALFWLHPLRDYWRRELGERHFERLQKVFPYTWLMDPAPLPYNAALPRIEINDWSELTHFSQKQRDLVLKISGFSPLAWGSRGVRVGSDLSQAEWTAAVETALAGFSSNPWVLQEFRHPRLVVHPYFDRETGEVREMKGRVRLCPYYFVDEEGAARLGGVLATIAPADKKLVHGMRDAILAPCMVDAA